MRCWTLYCQHFSFSPVDVIDYWKNRHPLAAVLGWRLRNCLRTTPHPVATSFDGLHLCICSSHHVRGSHSAETGVVDSTQPVVQLGQNWPKTTSCAARQQNCLLHASLPLHQQKLNPTECFSRPCITDTEISCIYYKIYKKSRECGLVCTRRSKHP